MLNVPAAAAAAAAAATFIARKPWSSSSAAVPAAVRGGQPRPAASTRDANPCGPGPPAYISGEVPAVN